MMVTSHVGPQFIWRSTWHTHLVCLESRQTRAVAFRWRLSLIVCPKPAEEPVNVFPYSFLTYDSVAQFHEGADDEVQQKEEMYYFKHD